MTDKRCSRCQRTKPLQAFNWRDKAHTRRQSYCRECSNGAWRAWYTKESNRQRHLAQLSRRRKARRKRHKSLINQLKSAPCKDCGQTFPPYVMDFDHVASKVAPVSLLATTHGTDALRTEIAKCEVVCANCHRIRTYERLRNQGTVPS